MLSFGRFLLIVAVLCKCAYSSQSDFPEEVTLRVALFPYIPDANDDKFAALQEKISSDFIKQQAQKGRKVKLDLRPMWGDDPTEDFYDLTTLEKFLKGPQPFDIVEIDGVMYDKIKELTSPWQKIDSSDWHPVAQAAAITKEGEMIGVPHWLCSHYIFGRTKDKDKFHAADSIEALMDHLQEQRPGSPFVADVVGSWNTLALYLHNYAVQHHDKDAPRSTKRGSFMWKEALGDLEGERFDWDTISAMRAFVKAAQFGTSNPALDGTYHDLASLSVQLFASSMAHGFLGYSERLFHILKQGKLVKLQTDDITCRHLPPFKKKNSRSNGHTASLVFVDLFVQRKDLSDAHQIVGTDFVNFMNSIEIMEHITLAKDVQEMESRIPRYLIPATQSARETLCGQKVRFYEELFKGIEDGVIFPMVPGVYEQVKTAKVSKKIIDKLI